MGERRYLQTSSVRRAGGIVNLFPEPMLTPEESAMVSGMKLRPYQEQAEQCVHEALSDKRSTLVVQPTGTGKTVLFGNVAHKWTTGRVLIIAHREELIFQAADKIERITGEKPDIEMAEYRASRHGLMTRSNVMVSSVQTLNAGRACERCQQESLDESPFEVNDVPGAKCEDCLGGVVRRMQRFDPMEFGLLIIDEAHHSTAPTYRRIIEYFGRNPNLKVLGVTATPDRSDEEALGRVFESVAFEYGILEAINEGWLVPIQQQWITVDGLDLSSVRTTAGDLNEGDLEKIMLEEENLHGVVSPTIEVAGDRATLVFSSSVRHAELTTDIFNRHKPNSAICITGGTPKELRREMLERYSKGEYQYLCGCGVFLEGFDEPRIQVIAMARPTKSRALYAQAIGRGTRPISPPIEETEELRRAAIAASSKPDVLVLDFVGNCGRHKLVSTADILGGELPDEFVDEAVRRAKAKGKPVNMSEEFIETQRQLALEKTEADRRKAVTAKAKFTARNMSPWDVFDIVPPREKGWDRGREPSEKMTALLEKAGINTNGLSFGQAKTLISQVIGRRNHNLASFKQMKVLRRFGLDCANWTFDRASKSIDAIAKNGWKLPANMNEPAPF